jgi:hypothetical protein
MLDRRYIRDWRGRFARTASSRSKPKTREKLASDLYRKRSEQMVANRKLYADNKPGTFTVTQDNGQTITLSRKTADYISKAKLTHKMSMEYIAQMDPVEREQFSRLSISEARSPGEARMIFRIRHGDRVELNGFDGEFYDRVYTMQALHSMDVMLTKYPEVQIDAFNTQPSHYFGDDPPIAWANREPIRTKAKGIGGRRYKISVEINDMYLNFPDRLAENEDGCRKSEFTHTNDGDNDYGPMGVTVIHEFGHLLDFTAWEGQYAKEWSWMNQPKATEEGERLAEVMENAAAREPKVLKEIQDLRDIANADPQKITQMHVDQMADLMKELDNVRKGFYEAKAELEALPKKYESEHFPTIAQGRNGSVRKAVERAYNRSVGRKESAPIGPKQWNVWDDFVDMNTRWASNYSVKAEWKSRDRHDPVDKRTKKERRQPKQKQVMNRYGDPIWKRTPYDRITGEVWWNYPELVAESFSDTEVNGENAKPISKEIHAQMIWQLEQGNGGIKAAFQRKKGKKK